MRRVFYNNKGLRESLYKFIIIYNLLIENHKTWSNFEVEKQQTR